MVTTSISLRHVAATDDRNVEYDFSQHQRIYLLVTDWYIFGDLRATLQRHSRARLRDYLGRTYRSRLSYSQYVYGVAYHYYVNCPLVIVQHRCICSCRYCSSKVIHVVVTVRDYN